MHLAEANIARARWPLDDPRMSGFVDALDRINAVADEAPGFVWRMQTESGNSLDVEAFADDRIIYNSSVWESVEALFRYTYASDHADFFRRRAEWFEPPTRSPVVCWWVENGHRPDIIEGRSRLKFLWRHGPSPKAFDLKTPFGPGGELLPENWRRDLAGTRMAACE